MFDSYQINILTSFILLLFNFTIFGLMVVGDSICERRNWGEILEENGERSRGKLRNYHWKKIRTIFPSN